MAGQIKVNTGLVQETATMIKNLNVDIRNAFSEPESAINALGAHWEGNASHNARSAFFAIKNAYFNDRYHVLDNYVNFLSQQVGEGYAQAEITNRQLADAFK